MGSAVPVVEVARVWLWFAVGIVLLALVGVLLMALAVYAVGWAAAQIWKWAHG